MWQPRNLEQMLSLFHANTKREVEQICRDLVIYSDDLFGVILAARAGGLADYRYACHFADRSPKHLNPTDAEREALGRSGVGKITDAKALKFLSKTDQIFVERKMFAAHLFHSPSHRYWHVFYFDQRDTTERKNHWAHGPHIHYTSDLIMRPPMAEMWNAVCESEAKSLKGLHVRYVDHHHKRARS